MNTLKNKVQLIGNVGQTPELTPIQKGKKLITFSLATHEYYHDSKGIKRTERQWHNIIAWGKPAELIERFIQKGEEIALEGKLIYETYLDRNGQQKQRTLIQMSDLLMLNKTNRLK